MLLNEAVRVSESVAATPSRKAKIEALARCLRQARGQDIPILVSFLSGHPRQRRLGVGWAALKSLPPPVSDPKLSLEEVDLAFQRLEAASGSGSSSTRSRELDALMSRATSSEQSFLRRLISGELRQGAKSGGMEQAIADAAEIPVDVVRRQGMASGSLELVASNVLGEGKASETGLQLHPGTPVQPMLAQSATSLDGAMARTGPAAIDCKLDGVRVQVHRVGDSTTVFTRSLAPITHRVPAVLDAIRGVEAESVILDGELISLRPDGRPRPFQETASRVASTQKGDEGEASQPLTLFVFDILHLDGMDLIDLPASQRFEIAAQVVPESLQVPRIWPADAPTGRKFLDDALTAGHEGVVVKSLASPYEAGRRGAGWIKVKSPLTLDLVVLAAEWGHGRREGWLSNLHLGAFDPETGSFAMLGKTFKGLTDAVLEWQTRKLQELEVRRDRWTVYPRPELVVEVAFDGIQTSSRYPSGMALRFARVVRYRADKRVEEADTLSMVRRLYESRL